MAILRQYPSLLLSCLDSASLQLKPAEGFTPDDRFVRREGVDAKIVVAWNELVKLIQGRFQAGTGDPSRRDGVAEKRKVKSGKRAKSSSHEHLTTSLRGSNDITVPCPSPPQILRTCFSARVIRIEKKANTCMLGPPRQTYHIALWPVTP